MENNKKLLFAVFLLLSVVSWSQVSMGINAGYASSVDGEDAYWLYGKWPTTGSNQPPGLITYYKNSEKGAKGFSKSVFVTWEVSKLFGVSLVYRNISFIMNDAYRKASNNSLGLRLHLNFRSHEKKFVPFIRGEYMFINSHTLKQETATGVDNQVQPSFELTFKSNLGIGGDLGAEVRLSPAIYLQVVGGFHGIQITGGKKVNFPLYVGSSIQQPVEISGTFFMQFSGGLKYYFSKRKKQRDF